jgi:N-acetylmuramic acid 6-phosphate etherase
LGQQLLRSLQLNEPDELIAWAQAAGKTDLAALAVEVFAAWRRGEPVASAVLDQAVQQLAIDAARCARRLVGKTMPVRFILAGGVLAQQPRFAQKVGRALRALWSGAEIIVLKGESAWGAVALAQRVYRQHALEQEKAPFKAPGVTARVSHFKSPAAASTIPGGLPEPAKAASDLELVAQSPTEQRHPKSMNLDRLSLAEAIELMLSEDAKIPKAILAERPRIERTIQLIARTLRHGGRLFYVGAGTSGRLGVLDASECPPTFGTSPDQVQGIIAGGQRALWEAVEGAEDDVAAGVRAMSFRGVIRRDVVVGIAASGRTPFVWGALREAKRRRAVTVLLTFNPVLRIRPADRPRQVIALDLGPEILTGSTRLKAGTATKLILNMLTTLAMVRLGKVISNLMVDLSPSNTKLRDRAVRIVEQLTGVGAERARAALARSGWVVKTACRRLRAFRD